MDDHDTYVQMIGSGGFFASCRTCGSDPFADRLTLAAAEADARAHGTLHHVYGRETLLEHNQRSADLVRARLPQT